MLDERSLRLLATCTARYLSEVVEQNSAIITFVGGNVRAVKREIEAALDEAEQTLSAFAKQREVVASAKSEPKTNREKIAEAVEEAVAAGAPNV